MRSSPSVPDLGLGDAELVDAVAHDRHGPVEVLREVAVTRRDGLQRDLEAWRSSPRVGRFSSGDPGIGTPRSRPWPRR